MRRALLLLWAADAWEGYASVATTRSVGAGQPLGEAQVRDGVALAGAPHFGRQRFQARKRDLSALAPRAQPTLLRAAAGKGELLSRITVSLDADADCTRFASAAAVTRTYDLLAVQPTSERAFASACATLDVDLISLDLCRRLPFKRVTLSWYDMRCSRMHLQAPRADGAHSCCQGSVLRALLRRPAARPRLKAPVYLQRDSVDACHGRRRSPYEQRGDACL